MFDRESIGRILKERFGFGSLRPGQEEALRSIVEGRDTLVVMPTGAGKSLIYQIAGLLIEGPTVVVSPLIALQHDQVENLTESGSRDAAVANSTQSNKGRRETFDALREGELEFLFLAPEQFGNTETMDNLAASPPSLVVVDEAHCISSWGHDFRPDYLKIGEYISALGSPPVLALTATASPIVREEVIQGLGMKEPNVVVQGFDRPNIHLSASRYADERSKIDALVDTAEHGESPAIVYVATRRSAEDLASLLWERGVQSVYYHGGMNASDREIAQEAFMKGDFEVVVATTAFGMGIDKADVRSILHFDIPDSIDSLYQEIGRAGRDGEPSRAHLFFRAEDLGVRKFFVSSQRLEESRRRLEETRLDMIRAYAETTECRRRFILNYFGEEFEPPCGGCDNCDDGNGEKLSKLDHPFEISDRVIHEIWGEGTIVRLEEDKIVVLFEEVGYKSLLTSIVQKEDLLRRA